MHKDDLILISVDDHIAEPADMFDAHVPAKYKDLSPRVVVEADGVQQWYYGEVRGRNMGLNAVAGKPREMYNIDASRYDEMRPGCFNVDERVRDMNAGGQLAGLNFPNFTGFSGQVLNQGPDRDVNPVMIKAYNDWPLDRRCAGHLGRVLVRFPATEVLPHRGRRRLDSVLPVAGRARLQPSLGLDAGEVPARLQRTQRRVQATLLHLLHQRQGRRAQHGLVQRGHAV